MSLSWVGVGGSSGSCVSERRKDEDELVEEIDGARVRGGCRAWKGIDEDARTAAPCDFDDVNQRWKGKIKMPKPQNHSTSRATREEERLSIR